MVVNGIINIGRLNIPNIQFQEHMVDFIYLSDTKRTDLIQTNKDNQN